ncbi:hypothetical protein IM697_00265 [Streptomyces ferrugineus]|uniref:Uncharacterized protein n=1 Tax=Streptomyces ferrugineus TaxID=1413221 RepID=A0A7M2SKQ1_9ACTN|nr:hypothetical protein [Streptomyces ferrugineus]QOV36950.1 hypothetical protein IM697_00265 [Streptomyces ferrugineus]
MRDELEELAVAERVARRLAEQLHAKTEREATPTQAAGQVAGRAALLVPQRERCMDEAVLPADYQQIMDVVRRAQGPVIQSALSEPMATVRTCCCHVLWRGPKAHMTPSTCPGWR